MNSQRQLHLRSGDWLFREGDAPTSAFLIESGTIEIRTDRGSDSLLLSVLGKGDLIGEMAVIDELARTETAIALTDCVLLVLDREQLVERLQSADPIVRALLEGQHKRYRGALSVVKGSAAAAPAAAAAADQTGVDKIRLESDLRAALAAGDLDVRYQPMLDLDTNTIAGYEALVRWTHPQRGPISPGQFVALAEETSLIVPVGEYVFDTAAAAIMLLHKQFPDICPFVAVNVSARQLKHAGLIERIIERVYLAGLPAGSLKVEITESQALDYPLVDAFIETCHAHGIKVALDDFGTGYSHLMHLHALQFDTLKIDQAFSRLMLTDKRSMAIVEAIIAIGRSLGADVAVEGVETTGQLDALRQLGCRYAQGYFIGRPLPLKALLHTLY